MCKYILTIVHFSTLKISVVVVITLVTSLEAENARMIKMLADFYHREVAREKQWRGINRIRVLVLNKTEK